MNLGFKLRISEPPPNNARNLDLFNLEHGPGVVTGMIYGDHQGVPVRLFQHHCPVPNPTGRGLREKVQTCALTYLPYEFQGTLAIRPAAAVSGFRSVDLGSREFARLYSVSGNRRLVHQVVQPMLIDMFLENPGLSLEIKGDVLILYSNGPLRAGDVRLWLYRLLSVRGLTPIAPSAVAV